VHRAFSFIVALVLMTGVIGVIFAGYHARDREELDQARPAAMARWQTARARIPGRPIGAVWMTHGRRICGLAGTTPFYLDGETIRLKTGTDRTFTAGWGECRADRWLELKRGS
jgi:hypothetical protein